MSISLPDASGAAPLTALAAGSQSAMALDSSGNVLTWGTGALGVGGTQTASRVPVDAALPRGEVGVAIGSGSSAGSDLAVLQAAATPPPPVEPVLRCQIIGNTNGLANAPSPNGCTIARADTSFTVDFAVQDGNGGFTWTVPNFEQSAGCNATSAFCDFNVKASTAEQDITVTVVTADSAGTPVDPDRDRHHPEHLQRQPVLAPARRHAMPSRFVTRRATPVVLALAGAVAAATISTTPGAAATRQTAATPQTAASFSLIAWGAGNGGQLGNGSTTTAASPVPVSLPSGTTVTAAAVGATHALTVTQSGSVLAWGTNNSGQLGNGTTTSTTTPVTVSLPSGTTATAVSAGTGFSLALTSSGSVLAWGANGSGQLGDGTGTTRTTPVAVHLPSGTTVTEVSAGSTFALALTSSGQILAWGGNKDGELGNLSGNGSSTPVPVTLPALPSGVTVADIAAGGTFGLARTSNGEVFAWGAGASGQLGDGATAASTPVAVALPSGASATHISAGAATGYALTGSGAMAWGAGTSGQLGNGTTANSSTPVAVSLPSSVTPVFLAGGSQGAVVSTHDGTLFTWGTGALGAGTSVTSSATPVSAPVPSGDSAFAVASGPAATADLALIEPTPPPFMEPVVPDLTGDLPSDAQTALQDVGLTLGTISTAPTSNCDLLGEVIRQAPLAGKSVPPGTAVNITTGTEIKNMCFGG